MIFMGSGNFLLQIIYLIIFARDSGVKDRSSILAVPDKEKVSPSTEEMRNFADSEEWPTKPEISTTSPMANP